MDKLTFSDLEHSVRYGVTPDDPQLVSSYIARAEGFISNQESISTKRDMLKRVLNTLINAIFDSYVPEHWRHHCLNNIYKPLHSVEQYAYEEVYKAEIRRFRYKLNSLDNNTL